MTDFASAFTVALVYLLFVFVGSWSFTDEHQIGLGVAVSKDDLLSLLVLLL